MNRIVSISDMMHIRQPWHT